MAGTVLPRGDPHSLPQLPVEDERELLNKGTQVQVKDNLSSPPYSFKMSLVQRFFESKIDCLDFNFPDFGKRALKVVLFYLPFCSEHFLNFILWKKTIG